MRLKVLPLLLIVFTFAIHADEADPFIWLEQVEEKNALTWVGEQNKRTLDLIESKASYKKIYDATLKILNSDDKIPDVSIRDGYVYNFEMNAEHVRGIYRRMKVEDFRQGSKNWETVLDIDALGKTENESWVYKGMECFKKSAAHCLVKLSRGGKDATVKREFNLLTKSFRTDGFVMPESKAGAQWFNEDQLLVDYDLEDSAKTTSGYPRIVKVWARGTELKTSPTIYEGEVKDVSVFSSIAEIKEKRYIMVGRALDFFNSTLSIRAENGELLPVKSAPDADLAGDYNGNFILRLGAAWNGFTAGSVITLGINEILNKQPLKYGLVMEPTQTRVIEAVGVSKNALYLGVLDKVRGKILRLTQDSQGKWSSEQVSLPQEGHAEIDFISDRENDILVRYGSYLTPSRLYAVGSPSDVTVLRQLPPMFDSSNLVEEQYWATSKDGTKVPYFIVRPKNMNLNGLNPTLLYGYGGFKVSLTPNYYATIGKSWMEAGGVYVVANIRGGGEFGPNWHLAALKEKRQTAYDDFIAVAEDLIARKITSAEKLAIQGGSNGGLLMGAVSMQRPDLFKAVLCQVPLLDMIRYTQLPPGASWIGEYGDPADPQMRAVIEKYSPYQNIRREKKYPFILFSTSTRDDRVHPGHARKMTAKMQSMGHPVYLFENTEGGHGGSADNVQRAKVTAITMTFLKHFLGME